LKQKIIFLIIISLVIGLTAGCISPINDTLKYPDSEEIPLKEINEDMLSEVLPLDGYIKTYITDDNKDTIFNWYEKEMADRDWKTVTEEDETLVFNKNGEFFTITILTTDELELTNYIEKHLIITVGLQTQPIF